MFYKINSKITGGILSKQKDNDRVIIIYHWNNCGHCRTFMPILYDLLHKYQNLSQMSNIFEVEYDNFKFLPDELRNVSAFPSIVSIEKGKKKDEFSDQRTHENLAAFIESNKALRSSYKSSSSIPSSSKRILKKYSSSSSRNK